MLTASMFILSNIFLKLTRFPRPTMHAIQRLSRPAIPARGVTLIELMVVVLIVAIIAAVAFPAYTSQIRKGNRAAAQSYMLEVASRQGEILADSHSYAAQTEIVGLVPIPAGVALNYTMTVTLNAAGTPPTFLITATAKGKQVLDGNLTLNHAGARTPETKW